MSQASLYRTFRVAAALVVTACAGPSGENLLTSVAEAPSQAKVASDVTPASLGWQAQARTLAAANNMSPLAATRVFASLSSFGSGSRLIVN